MAITRDGVTIQEGIPTDLHPEGLLGDSEPVHAGKHALDAVYTTVGTILKTERDMGLAERPNPILQAEIARLGMPHLEKTAATVGTTIDSVERTKQLAEAAISSALKAKDAAIAAEVRTYLRSKEKGVVTELLTAARNGDVELVAAALSAPHYLSGLTAEQASELRNIAALTFAPGHSAMLDDCNRVLERLNRAQEYLVDWSRKAKSRWLDSSAATKALQELTVAKARQPSGRTQI
ncbi:MAG: hypothetical protein CTY20_07830 [Hyphomicrobium sp.]|nr:MAG: hypothetical protein CTY20_07830 [Hyphomicrobium sp.]